MSKKTAETPTLADDLIWGGGAIAREIGMEPEKKVFYQLEVGNLPAKKIGGQWVASRKKLRALFDDDEAV
jgi:hypothetical protein